MFLENQCPEVFIYKWIPVSIKSYVSQRTIKQEVSIYCQS
jgi:hypothetical protein